MKTILIILMLLPTVAHAGKFSLVLNGHAAHFQHVERFNGEYETFYKRERKYYGECTISKCASSWEMVPYKREVRKSVNFNERNYGIGFEYKINRGYFYNGGTFIDSFNKPQYYVGGGRWWSMFNVSGISSNVGLVGGLITHSEVMDGKIPFPFALPVATIGYKKVHLQTTYVPKLTKTGSDFAWFQLKIDF